MGRPKNEHYWNQVTKLKDGIVQCKHCKHEFKAAGVSRIIAHVDRKKNRGVKLCHLDKIPQGVHSNAGDNSGNSQEAANEMNSLEGNTEMVSAQTTTTVLDTYVSYSSMSKVQDGYVTYSWEKEILSMFTVPNSSDFISILFLPKASNQETSRYNDLEDILAMANAWLNASIANGVPIVFKYIQMESLTEISRETISSTLNVKPLSGVARALRLWYAPSRGEFSIVIKTQEDDTKLGFAISRQKEGFIYISTVTDQENVPAARSGLSNMLKQATQVGRLLVVSRISNQKILPWMVSSEGAIRCYDTVSLQQNINLLRKNRIPIVLHFFHWDGVPISSGKGNTVEEVHHPNEENQVLSLPLEALSQSGITGELPQSRFDIYTTGEFSMFDDFDLFGNYWL